jgi:hypothetical protein
LRFHLRCHGRPDQVKVVRMKRLHLIGVCLPATEATAGSRPRGRRLIDKLALVATWTVRNRPDPFRGRRLAVRCEENRHSPAGYSLISINTRRWIGTRCGRKLVNSDGDGSAKPPSVTASVATGNRHPGERKSHRIRRLFPFSSFYPPTPRRHERNEEM